MVKQQIGREVGKVVRMVGVKDWVIVEWKGEPLALDIKKRGTYKEWVVLWDGRKYYLVNKDSKVLSVSKSIKKVILKGFVDSL